MKKRALKLNRKQKLGSETHLLYYIAHTYLFAWEHFCVWPVKSTNDELKISLWSVCRAGQDKTMGPLIYYVSTKGPGVGQMLYNP